MTDAGHELVTENQRLRDRVDELTALARRALLTAIEEQDRADGAHDVWLDEALGAVDESLADPV
jgi:hypothetical protein